jgi:glycolate oxidase FAD binding subunit
VTRRAPSAQEAAFHGAGREVLAPADTAELAAVVRETEARGGTLVPVGAGAHSVLIDPLPDDAVLVSVSRISGIAAYEPDDFTIGVRAGTPISTLRETLAEHRQEIPFDAPAGARGTAGGLVARAPASPRQGRYGVLGSCVLGVEGLHAGGSSFRSGGMVVKDVAGYQLHKFLVGSLGSAAFLLRVNFRLRPIPARRRLFRARFAEESDAWSWAARLAASGLEPAALAVLEGECLPSGAHGGAMTCWFFEGGAATVDWQARSVETLRPWGEAESSEGDDGEAARFLETLAGLGEAGGGIPDSLGIVRIAVLPSALAGTAALVRDSFRERPGFAAGLYGDPTTGLLTVRWSGPAESIDAPVKSIRQIVRSRDGVAKLLYLPPPARARFRHRLTGDPNLTLTESVLRAFDPRGTFARRRSPASVVETEV